jgi:hypothetical protein
MNHYNLRTIACALSLGIGMFAAVGNAQAAWGAVAYESGKGTATKTGWSFNYGNQADAEARALRECRAQGGNCDTVSSYAGACAVLGFGTQVTTEASGTTLIRPHHIFTRGHASIRAGERRLQQLCSDTGTASCTVLFTGCSG